MTNKEWYDTEIAPKLLEIAQQCEAHGVSMIAAVEYAPHEIGHTFTLQENAGLEIIAINHCTKTMPNIDGFILGLLRFCNEHGIDYSGSLVLRQIASKGK